MMLPNNFSYSPLANSHFFLLFWLAFMSERKIATLIINGSLQQQQRRLKRFIHLIFISFFNLAPHTAAVVVAAAAAAALWTLWHHTAACTRRSFPYRGVHWVVVLAIAINSICNSTDLFFCSLAFCSRSDSHFVHINLSNGCGRSSADLYISGEEM
jgi:hypothetical protein